MKRRNLLTSALVGACLLFSASALVSCGVKPESSSSSEIAQQMQIEQIYAQYVAYTETIGGQPLSYEAWLASIRGEDGEDGKSAYQIWLENGYEGSETDFLAWLKGEKGEQGIQGEKGEQGVGIEKVEYNENGNLVITYTDGSTQTVVLPKEEHTHKWGDGIVLKEATFAEEGAKIYICNCGETKHEVLPELYYSKGLEYTLNEDEESYSVIGIGTCTDTDIVIPSTYENFPVMSIGEKAFFARRSLTSIELPDSVRSIGAYAFAWCDSLTSIEIPVLVENIGRNAFIGCDVLTSIIVPKNNNAYQSIDGNLYTKNGKILIQYAIGKAEAPFIVPNSVTTIEDNAFYECASLTSLVIGDSVTSIGSFAFYCCTSLTSVEIGDSVMSIGYQAFDECTSLTNLMIGQSVTYIGGFAFSNCASLTSVTIPTSVVSIDGGAFCNCDSLTNLEIPNSVTNIGACAFQNCDSLISIVIPNSVMSIGKQAFYDCNSLKSVVIPNSVTSIGDYAFWGCTSLTSVVIPASVTSIGDYVFFDCTSLTSVYYKGTAEEWSAIAIGEENTELTDTTRYYYSESQPTEAGNWWHYVNGQPTIW